MNNLTLQGDWNITKGRLKQKYAQLTDSDLTFVQGKEDELLGRLQKRLGIGRDEVERALREADRRESGQSASGSPNQKM